MEINPYVTYPGNAREALEFYAAALGGEIDALMTIGEIPDAGEVSEGYKDKLAHGRIIFPSGTLMVSDTWEGMPHDGFSGFNIQTSWGSVDAARAAYDAMREGGTVIMEFAPTFWAAGFGLITDKFGVGWMFNCDVEGSQ